MELEHAGKSGMKWGIRNYQNKDGTWTPLGLKMRRQREGGNDSRSDDNSPRASSTLRRLKKTFMKKSKTEETEKPKEETPEEKKAREERERKERHDRAIKSTNAKELLANKDVLSTAELKERIDRIKTEQELAKYIKEEPSRIDRAMEKANKVINTTKKVGEVYNAVNSKEMKALKRSLGLEKTEPYKSESVTDLYKRIRNMTDDEVQKAKQRYVNEDLIRRYAEAEEERRRQANNNP